MGGRQGRVPGGTAESRAMPGRKQQPTYLWGQCLLGGLVLCYNHPLLALNL